MKKEEEGRKEGKKRRLPSKELEDQMQQDMHQSTLTPTPPPHPNLRKMRRKGIPHRAPLM